MRIRHSKAPRRPLEDFHLIGVAPSDRTLKFMLWRLFRASDDIQHEADSSRHAKDDRTVENCTDQSTG